MDQYTISILIPSMAALLGVVIGSLITWKILKDQQIREWRRAYLESVWMPLMKEVSNNYDALRQHRRLAPKNNEYMRISKENKDWVIDQPLYKDIADFYEFSFSKMNAQVNKIRTKGQELVKEMLPPGDTPGNMPDRGEVILAGLNEYRYLGEEAVGLWLGFNWAAIHESDIKTIYNQIKEPFKLDKSYKEFRGEFKDRIFSSEEWTEFDKEYNQTIEKAHKLRIKLAGIVGSYRKELS